MFCCLLFVVCMFHCLCFFFGNKQPGLTFLSRLVYAPVLFLQRLLLSTESEEYPPVLYIRTYDVHTVNCDAIAVNCMYVVRMYVLLYYLV